MPHFGWSDGSDPFVILLALTTILYFSLRIYTLTLYEFSHVFDRYAYDAADSNYALIFILIANLFLYFGLYLVKIKGRQEVDAAGWQAASSTRIVLLLVAAIFFAYFQRQLRPRYGPQFLKTARLPELIPGAEHHCADGAVLFPSVPKNAQPSICIDGRDSDRD